MQPSTQNSNLADYKSILNDCGLLQKIELPKFYGLRRFAKAYDFFWNQLPDTKEELDILMDKINRLVFIHISVGTQADAFTLFETLNKDSASFKIFPSRAESFNLVSSKNKVY